MTGNYSSDGEDEEHLFGSSSEDEQELATQILPDRNFSALALPTGREAHGTESTFSTFAQNTSAEACIPTASRQHPSHICAHINDHEHYGSSKIDRGRPRSDGLEFQRHPMNATNASEPDQFFHRIATILGSEVPSHRWQGVDGEQDSLSSAAATPSSVHKGMKEKAPIDQSIDQSVNEREIQAAIVEKVQALQSLERNLTSTLYRTTVERHILHAARNTIDLRVRELSRRRAVHSRRQTQRRH